MNSLTQTCKILYDKEIIELNQRVKKYNNMIPPIVKFESIDEYEKMIVNIKNGFIDFLKLDLNYENKEFYNKMKNLIKKIITKYFLKNDNKWIDDVIEVYINSIIGVSYHLNFNDKNLRINTL